VLVEASVEQEELQSLPDGQLLRRSFPISLSLIDWPVLVLAPLRFAIGINLAISVDHDSVNTGDCHK